MIVPSRHEILIDNKPVNLTLTEFRILHLLDRSLEADGVQIFIGEESGYTTLKKSGGELKLLKVSDRIENIFIVSKLYTVFESYQDEDEAVQSFA